MTLNDSRELSQSRLWFWWLFWGSLMLKLTLSAVFPITGDEALFVQWGKRPDWGYYDHPPMIGWWLSVVMMADDGRWLIRLLTVLTTHLVALGIVDILSRRHPQSPAPWLTGSIYLALPWTWMFFLVTTDTPVVLFMAMAVWCFLRGFDGHRSGWFWCAGTLLGLAFLSKYFAVLLGLAFAAAVLVEKRQRLSRLLALTVPGLACAAYNLGFNATHGWPNIMFNLFARQDESRWNVSSLVIYLLMMAYLLTPWLVWQAVRKPSPTHATGGGWTSRTTMLLWAVPLGFFAIISLRREVGLHWVLGFVPWFMVWSAERLQHPQLQKSLRYTLMLSMPHVLLVLILLAWPTASIKSVNFREKVVFFRHSPEITQLVSASLPPNTTLMGTGYSAASVMAYSHGQYVPVFGRGSKYARQDDLWTDFQVLQGHAIRIFTRNEVNTAEYAPFFDRVETGKIEFQGAHFFYIDGYGFRYSAYKEQVLDEIHQKYFNIPNFLPIYGNPFCERYGYTNCAPGRQNSKIPQDAPERL